jgi:phage gp36-like protein
MAYCAVSDVQNDFKAVTFTSSSLVTDSAVSGFISEASALIDSYVGQRYVTPITGAQALALMSLYARTLVADRVRGILANKQQTNTDANQQVKSDGFSVRDVMKSLQDIKNGDAQLVDAVLLNSNASFFSNNYDRGVSPRFHKNRREW